MTLTRPPANVGGSRSDQVFYPSVVCNFILRFDESLTYQTNTLPAPDVQTGIVDAVSGIVNAVSAPLARVTKSLLFSSPTSSGLTRVLNRVPKTATIELPAYRTAGKFTLEIDWRELPIDPRLIRSAAVSIYVGSVSPSDFSSGMTAVDPLTRVRRSVLQTADASGQPRTDLLAIHGIIDNWAITHGDKSSIKMEGRDLRGVFLDSPINPDVVAKVDLRKDIINVVHDILLPHPASQMMTILWNPQDWPNLTPPSVADPEGLTRVRRGADGAGTSGGSQSGDKANFWDLVVNYCYLVGAVPFFRGKDLVIRPARSLFDQSKPSGQSPTAAQTNKAALLHPGATIGQTWDPVFGGSGVRYDDDGKPFYVRKFILGRNIKTLAFERKFTGVKSPVIKLVSYDTSSTNRGASKLLTAEYPPQTAKDARVTGVSPSGSTSQTDVMTISVPGVRDQKQLNSMAKDLFEEIGRGETGGSCETGFLSTFKGDNSDPDVLRVRPGHAAEFVSDTRSLTSIAPAASSELALERMSFDDAARSIQRVLGSGDANLARAIVASSRSAVFSLLQTYRVANVNFQWSQSKGIETKFDFQNYFVPRAGVTEQTGANTMQPTRVPIQRTPRTEPTGQVTPTQQTAVQKPSGG